MERRRGAREQACGVRVFGRLHAAHRSYPWTSPPLFERAVPVVQQQPVFKGLYVLAERKMGEHLAITLWDSEQRAESMAAQGQPVRFREEAGRRVGGAASPTSKNYEVIFRA